MRIAVKILSIIAIVGFILIPGFSHAQKFSKNEIKAAFVFNFVQFVTWPAEKDSLTLGIVGNNEFTNVLKLKLNHQKIGNRVLKIIQYSVNQKTFNCDVIFMAHDDAINMDIILEEIKNKPILSIGETDGFCLKGGIINLIESDNGNYFFEINHVRALKQKIGISSKLLKLAIQVE